MSQRSNFFKTGWLYFQFDILCPEVISVSPERKRWIPVSPEDHADVLRALEGVLESSYFSNSKRYPALLRYVVEQTLLGHGDELKERTVGIDVFGRPPDL